MEKRLNEKSLSRRRWRDVAIYSNAGADLAQVVQAGGASGFGFGDAQNRQQQCRQDSDDSDDHQQLDQGESSAAPEITSHAHLDKSPAAGSRRTSSSSVRRPRLHELRGQIRPQPGMCPPGYRKTGSARSTGSL